MKIAHAKCLTSYYSLVAKHWFVFIKLLASAGFAQYLPSSCREVCTALKTHSSFKPINQSLLNQSQIVVNLNEPGFFAISMQFSKFSIIDISCH